MAKATITPEVPTTTVLADDGAVYEFTMDEYQILDRLTTEILKDAPAVIHESASLDYVAGELRFLERGQKTIRDLIERGYIEEVSPERITYTDAGSIAFFGRAADVFGKADD